MSKFSIDYQQLSNSVDKKTYKLSEVSDRIEKVAFDIVKLKGGNPDELWQIQNSDDGDYIVARYNDDTILEEKVAKNDWEVLVSNGSSLNIFYKGYPLAKFAASQFGLENSDLSTMKSFLPNKLASDQRFVEALVNSLDENKKKEFKRLCVGNSQ